MKPLCVISLTRVLALLTIIFINHKSPAITCDLHAKVAPSYSLFVGRALFFNKSSPEDIKINIYYVRDDEDAVSEKK